MSLGDARYLRLVPTPNTYAACLASQVRTRLDDRLTSKYDTLARNLSRKTSAAFNVDSLTSFRLSRAADLFRLRSVHVAYDKR